MGDSSTGFPDRCSSWCGVALEGEQFVPGFGAVCVELEHLLLEVCDDILSCKFLVEAQAGIVPLNCRFNIAESADIFGGTWRRPP